MGYTPVSAPLGAFLRYQEPYDLWHDSQDNKTRNTFASVRLRAETARGAQVVLYDHSLRRVLGSFRRTKASGENVIVYGAGDIRSAIRDAERGTRGTYGLPLVTLIPAEEFIEFQPGSKIPHEQVWEHPQTKGFFGSADSALGDIAKKYCLSLATRGFEELEHTWDESEQGVGQILSLNERNGCRALQSLSGGLVLGLGRRKPVSANVIVDRHQTPSP